MLKDTDQPELKHVQHGEDPHFYYWDGIICLYLKEYSTEIQLNNWYLTIKSMGILTYSDIHRLLNKKTDDLINFLYPSK